ncbi:hypothetical protein AAFF_G00309310 [Aldrovandia affinis]|uniref:Uncharacterized protein n=1 Tax=Aldrovandia affinis TaxID=143900 RepID=A0AAD7SP54_9TELE|nr:hypothetical protein AAFF_G00309310 [Aldrovandia affinis]
MNPRSLEDSSVAQRSVEMRPSSGTPGHREVRGKREKSASSSVSLLRGPESFDRLAPSFAHLLFCKSSADKLSPLGVRLVEDPVLWVELQVQNNETMRTAWASSERLACGRVRSGAGTGE